MPLSLRAYDDAPLCFGHTWTIIDEDLLAYLVARLVLGQWLHVAAILESGNPPAPSVSAQALERLTRKLTVADGGAAALRWHRDGWVFQLISWIAARKGASGHVLVRPPQQRKADKGFDGLIIELSPSSGDGAILTICEDKATDNARNTITSKVWPEITMLENGDRDEELVNEVSAMLDKRLSESEVLVAVEQLQWKGTKRYRVCVTVDQPHDQQPRRASLFGGYDSRATGAHVRRRGETLWLADLRSWMDAFCVRVTHHLAEMLGEPSV